MTTRRTSLCISLAAFAILLFIAPHSSAQQPSQTVPAGVLPVYDIASIHENKTGTDNVRISTRDATFTATNVALGNLVSMAYDIRLDIISGLPGWAQSTRFDISAKVSEPDIDALKKLSREQRHAMLVALLANRFHLKAHVETKTLPVYDLVVAKGGSKLAENTIPLDQTGPLGLKPGSMMISEAEMTAVAVPISNLAQNLAFRVERNVIDKTGLTGKYNFTLKWRPDELEGKADATTDSNAPDLFTALQEQLGLRLEPSKGPVDTLVIDHVEMPSEN
jgi:uncharacterized protein (TIGR03435 family)